eukprot:TRINITY_DN28039_c0_g1_i1.p1 TRINITY_DN28039_c0_g1~~TRINITY_DN28039_c0_g1_i1.p1  ORF type:complete len:625 (-),score=83.51 TRINITY_DN28039_c0_g1_i1:303-2177(-)
MHDEAVEAELWGVFAIIGINLAALFVYLTVFLLRLYKAMRSCVELRSAAVARLLAGFASVRQHFAKRDSEDPFERKVRALAAEARVQRIKTTCDVGVHLSVGLSICTLIGFRYIEAVTLRWTGDRVWWELHQSGFALLTLTLLMGLFGWLWPSRLSVWSLNIYHMLLFSRLCWQTCTCNSVFQVLASEHLSGGVRFFSAVTLGTPGWTLGMNMTLSALKVSMFSTLFVALDTDERQSVFLYWGDAKTYLINEIFLCCATWTVSTIVDAWNYASVRANLQAKASSTSEVTVKAILVVLCDAVVTVDKDLAFCTHAMEIASFLVRRPLNNSYKGCSLLELVEEDDRDHVRSRITAALMGHGTALSFSTRLIDGNGNPLSVQMYCTCFIDINDCRCYVIGILEVKEDVTSGSNQREDVFAVEYSLESSNGLRGSGALHSASEMDCDSFKSVEESSVDIPLVTEEEEVEIWIDIAEGSMPVVNTNLLARAIIGPQAPNGTSFLEWLRAGDAAEVVHRIGDGWDRYTEDSSRSQVDIGVWHLRPRHAMRAGLEYKARMTLDMTRVVRNELFGTQICVCIRCDYIGVQTLQRKTRKKQRSLNAPSSNGTEVQRTVTPVPSTHDAMPSVSL